MISNKNIVDFHSHILPEADHGSDSIETSLFQIKCAAEQGITKIIATPHFYPHQHTVDDFVERRNNAYLRLKGHICDVKVKLGAEVLLYPGLENMEGLDKLFVFGTNTLLLELPFTQITDEHYESVKAMINSGIDVVLAHAERYSVDTIERMIGVGARLQLNATSVFGFKKNKNTYFKWLKSGRVVALGSDIHGRDKRAYKMLAKCYKKINIDADVIIKESNLIWNRASIYVKNPTR